MSEKSLEQRIADLHSKYGVKIDKTFVVMVDAIRDEVVHEIKKQDRPVYQMASKGQAFLYGLGKNLWLSVLVLSITVLSLVWYFYISDNYRYREASLKGLSKEQQLALDKFKGLILSTWGTGQITQFIPEGSSKAYDVLQIPKSSMNQIAPAGMSYFADSLNIYIRLK